jgi:hypothetical protein
MGAPAEFWPDYTSAARGCRSFDDAAGPSARTTSLDVRFSRENDVSFG